LAGGGSVSINDTSITAPTINLQADGGFAATGSGGIFGTESVGISSGNGLTLGMNVSADTESGEIVLENSTGLLTVNNGAVLKANSISINSPDGVLIDSIGAPVASTMTVTAGSVAGDLVTIQNSDLGNVSALNVSAHTQVYNNVNFSGHVTLDCLNGVLAPGANTGAATVPGDVNFYQNVTYNHNPAQNYINSANITIGTSGSTFP
jgi:hypothetical protein